ncbi:MAG: Arm DNA-binding domain-containing protein, partial [Burkholderiaceae bacterium]
MTRLTDLAIRNLKPQTERMVADGGGLYLRLRPDGAQKHWIFRFTQAGKTQKMQIGIYPHVGLSEARERARHLAKEHKSGLNPVAERDRKREESRLKNLETSLKPSVRQLFSQWAATDLKAHKDAGASVRRAFEKDVLPAIGQLQAEVVQKAHLTSIVDRIVARGS